MKLYLDVDGMEFMVSRAPEEKTEQGNKQRVEKETGRLMWATQIFVQDEEGGEVIMVTTAGDKPMLSRGQRVIPQKLIAIPWSMVDNGKHRHGVSFRADGFRVLGEDGY